MKDNSASSGRKIRMSFTLAAAVYLALGVLMLCAPHTSRALLCTLAGAGMTAYGLMGVLSFCIARGERQLTLELLIGVCAAAFGVFSLFNPSFLMDFLFTVMGVMILVTSTASLRRALALRRFGFYRWQAPLACSIVCMLFALSAILFPGFYGDMLMRVLGLLLIVDAVDDLTTLYLLSRYTRDMR